MAVLVLATGAIGLAMIILSPFDRRRDAIWRLGRLWGRIIMLVCGARLAVEGADRLDPRATYVFAGNHQSALDIPVLMAALPNRFGYLAKKELFAIPFFGRVMRAGGCIPVDRSEGRAAIVSMREAAGELDRGYSIFVFPEGTRGPGDTLLPFKSGGFMLAVQSGKSVVPVTVIGSRLILPPGAWRLEGTGLIKVVIDRPIPAALKRREELARLVKEHVSANLPGQAAPRTHKEISEEQDKEWSKQSKSPALG
jgi:1-acyl-sn-glycerol-3-phosphate acyltransferase